MDVTQEGVLFGYAVGALAADGPGDGPGGGLSRRRRVRARLFRVWLTGLSGVGLGGHAQQNPNHSIEPYNNLFIVQSLA